MEEICINQTSIKYNYIYVFSLLFSFNQQCHFGKPYLKDNNFENIEVEIPEIDGAHARGRALRLRILRSKFTLSG